jgi:hypothetical protein
MEISVKVCPVQRSVGVALLACLHACLCPNASAQAGGTRADTTRGDSLKRTARSGLIPAGFGTLRQDDVALQVENLGLQVKLIPLDESVIRTLAPDSYKALHTIRENKARQLDSIRTRLGLPAVQAWLVTFFNAQQGEARYDAMDLIIRSAGRDFRPLDALAVKPGFGDGRLAQRESRSAVYAFDPVIDLTQPITVTIGTQTSSAWNDIAQRIELERSFVWSRAGAAKP